jgi:hypothetical protein
MLLNTIRAYEPGLLDKMVSTAEVSRMMCEEIGLIALEA